MRCGPAGGERHGRQPAELHRHIYGYEGDGPGRCRREVADLLEKMDVTEGVDEVTAREVVTALAKQGEEVAGIMPNIDQSIELSPLPSVPH